MRLPKGIVLSQSNILKLRSVAVYSVAFCAYIRAHRQRLLRLPRLDSKIAFKSFRELCKRLYGNLFRAWKVIDDDESWSARGKSERRTRRLGRRQHTKRTELAIKRTLTPEEL